MAKEKVTVGTGITAREIVKYSGPDMQPAIRQWLSGAIGNLADSDTEFEARSLEMVRICRSIVEDAGAPPYDADSPPWFAQRVLSLHKLVQKHIADGKADLAAVFAFSLGSTWGTATMKWDWEPATLTGLKVRHEIPGAEKGGRKPGGKISRDVEMAREFQRRRSSSNASDTALKQKIGLERDLKRAAAIEAINRGLKKLSG